VCLVFAVLKVAVVWLQAKIQKHQAFEAEISAHANTLDALDRSGAEMIDDNHFASETIKVTCCVRFWFNHFYLNYYGGSNAHFASKIQ